MRYVITYINITKEKRYHYVIVILNIDSDVRSHGKHIEVGWKWSICNKTKEKTKCNNKSASGRIALKGFYLQESIKICEDK